MLHSPPFGTFSCRFEGVNGCRYVRSRSHDLFRDPGRQGGASTAQKVNVQSPTAQSHDTEADPRGCAEPLQEAARAGSTKGAVAVTTPNVMVIRGQRA